MAAHRHSTSYLAIPFSRPSRWRYGTVASFSLDGTLEGDLLTIALRLDVALNTGEMTTLHIALWEPGITNVDIHAASTLDTHRPLVIIDTIEESSDGEPPTNPPSNPMILPAVFPGPAPPLDDDDALVRPPEPAPSPSPASITSHFIPHLTTGASSNDDASWGEID